MKLIRAQQNLASGVDVADWSLVTPRVDIIVSLPMEVDAEELNPPCYDCRRPAGIICHRI